ncbi:MAG: Fe-S-binding domain-containing protein [Anaerolinea sp.]|nr:Fe-S-binding domain-containing protein [Anaerolinea sp.]
MNIGLNPLLLVTFFPLAGALVVLLLKPKWKTALRWTALVTSLITFGLSIWMLTRFNDIDPEIQFELNLPWITLGNNQIGFHLGIDGISILMVLLTTFLMPLAILSTWKAVEERIKGFMAFFLLLEVGMLGVFLSLDMVLFYVFWEFTLIPMYFLIGLWGGERRVYAAVKFFLYTMAGSVLMLAGILWIGLQYGSFDLTQLSGSGLIPAAAQLWLFGAFGLAFAIKVPMFPLHSWLPDAHTEAPTAGSVILAGILLKMGAYGFLRFNLPLFPNATVTLAPWMAGLAVIGILYGAAVAYLQKDVKRLVAYSSISHLGFVVLGIFALNLQGLQGAILQMVNHGLSTGALFLIVGMLYERRHTRLLENFGGLWKVVPVLGTLALITTLSSVGLPGLNGFVSEFTILLGAFSSTVIGSPWFAGVATLGVILAAVYLLFMFQKLFLGPVTHEENKKLKDVSAREILILTPILIFAFWIGIYPKPFFMLMAPAVEKLTALVQSAALLAH